MPTPIDFPGSNTNFGKPKGWDDNECGGLPANQGCMVTPGGRLIPNIESCWQFNEAEIAEIVRTKQIRIGIVGLAMPPIIVSVSPINK